MFAAFDLVAGRAEMAGRLPGVGGDLPTVPYGRIAEPFTAYVDMTSGQSRLDTYGGEIF